MRNVTIYYIACLFLMGITTSLLADEISAEHAVSDVAVFPNSAVITRTGSLKLSPGEHTVFFAGVPSGLTAASLQMKAIGSSELQLLSAEIVQRPKERAISEPRIELENEIKSLQYLIREKSIQQKRVERERTLLHAIPLTRSAEAESALRSVTEVKQLLAFISEGSTLRDNEFLLLEKEIAKLNEQKLVLDKRLSSLGREGEMVTAVAVTVRAIGDFIGKMNLSYETTRGAVKWSPAYRTYVSLDSLEPEIILESYAVLKQFTGEDWENISLRISTTEPDRRLERPTAFPQVLNVRSPHQKRTQAKSASRSSMLAFDMAGAESAGLASPVAAVEESRTVFSELSDSGPLAFKVSGKMTIKSAGNENRVPLSRDSLKGEMRYITVPAQIPQVYQEMKVKNSLSYPLLSGKRDLFIDGAFSGSSQLPFIKQGESFVLALGEAQDMTVKRSLLSSFEDDSGVIRSFRRIKKSFILEMENLSDETRELVILEGAPLSQNAKVKVEFSEVLPALVENKEKRIDSREGILEWHISLAAKKKSTAKYTSTIEFKSDILVTGLPEF